jgi:hypothetical protein
MVATKAVAEAGVGPAVLYTDPATGVFVSRFIDGAATMSPVRFAERPGAAARAGKAFRKLHESGAVFPARFELFAMIDSYLAVLATKDVALPTGYHDVLGRRSVRAALSAHPLPSSPAIAIPLCENFLDTGDPHVDRRLGIFRHERPDVGPRRPLGRGRLSTRIARRRCSAPISAASPARQIAGQDHDLQGDVRPSLDPLGSDPAGQRQPGRRFPPMQKRALPVAGP